MTIADLFLTTDDRRGSSSPCRRSCCWSPFGHSGAADEMCTCHLSELLFLPESSYR